MLDVNPHITVETFQEQLNSENALRICDGYDVVSASWQDQPEPSVLTAESVIVAVDILVLR